jgi:hypothetical protein
LIAIIEFLDSFEEIVATLPDLLLSRSITTSRRFVGHGDYCNSIGYDEIRGIFVAK